mmetsp:Transcript_91832/g.259347  ORF Transcript_91832/g.259347 Transcript_91832/m.259347 type:complete len:277 (+) Transcript_91832:972-1802(+)
MAPSRRNFSRFRVLSGFRNLPGLSGFCYLHGLCNRSGLCRKFGLLLFPASTQFCLLQRNTDGILQRGVLVVYGLIAANESGDCRLQRLHAVAAVGTSANHTNSVEATGNASDAKLGTTMHTAESPLGGDKLRGGSCCAIVVPAGAARVTKPRRDEASTSDATTVSVAAAIGQWPHRLRPCRSPSAAGGIRPHCRDAAVWYPKCSQRCCCAMPSVTTCVGWPVVTHRYSWRWRALGVRPGTSWPRCSAVVDSLGRRSGAREGSVRPPGLVDKSAPRL